MSVIKPHILKVASYNPPLEGRDPDKSLLLDFNERIIPPGGRVKEALVQFLDSKRLNLYPSYGDIRKPLAAYAGVEPDQILLTNGSDHGIEVIFRAVCNPGDSAIIVEPCFDIYRQVARIEDLRILSPVYTDDYKFPTSEVLANVRPEVKVIVVANPNNPTGTMVAPEEIDSILKAAPHAAVLVDECYYEYTKVTVKDRIEQYPNLFITRTFSKTWGMPSVRFGYIITSRANAAELNKVRGPYAVNQLSVVAAAAALEDPSYMRSYVEELLTVSKPLFEDFLRDRGLKFWPSAANYYLVMFDQPEKVEARLREAGIRVRPKPDNRNRIGLRITIGPKAETERLIAAIASILNSI